MEEPTIKRTPCLSDLEVKQLSKEYGLSTGEIRDCYERSSNPKQCLEEKRNTRNTNFKKKKEDEEKKILNNKEEEIVEIEEEVDFMILRWYIFKGFILRLRIKGNLE